MIVLRRRLFWKIYLTFLSSLIAVALLMGAVWRLVGETPNERWGALRIHLNSELVPTRDLSASAAVDAVRRLGDEIGADVSVYGGDGRLVAAHGRPVPVRDDLTRQEQHHLMRIDLPDGRVVMARLRPPVQDPGLRILIAVMVVAGAVGLAAFPITARLTRRLEALRVGMARWGAGDTTARVDERGTDEVALVAQTFNTAAERLDAMLRSQRELLANASHELRSPIARLRIAVELWLEQPAVAIHAEIIRNLAEVDALVEEILLSSRLDHPSAFIGRSEQVDLLGLAAEEASRVGATVDGAPVEIGGNATLLRRMLRNLLENAFRHGKAPIHVEIAREGPRACISVSDRGQGVPVEERGRVFEPFYRPSGRSEDHGGWGLGLSLVRQIAAHHQGRVTCDEAPDGGSRFVVQLPIDMTLTDDQRGSGAGAGSVGQAA